MPMGGIMSGWDYVFFFFFFTLLLSSFWTSRGHRYVWLGLCLGGTRSGWDEVWVGSCLDGIMSRWDLVRVRLEPDGIGVLGRSRSVAPVAYQVILDPGIGRFREFESPRLHTGIISWGFFLCTNLTCGKRESVS